jgi:plasmid maintenance system antidote protein VapI
MTKKKAVKKTKKKYGPVHGQPVHPGVVVNDYIDNSRRGIGDLAKASGLAVSTLYKLRTKQARITHHIAIGLQKAFARPVRFWLGLQKSCDEASLPKGGMFTATGEPIHDVHSAVTAEPWKQKANEAFVRLNSPEAPKAAIVPAPPVMTKKQEQYLLDRLQVARDQKPNKYEYPRLTKPAEVIKAERDQARANKIIAAWRDKAGNARDARNKAIIDAVDLVKRAILFGEPKAALMALEKFEATKF